MRSAYAVSKRDQQVHEALEFFLCESFAKHGERCRIWEAERFSTAERIALGVGRTRVRDEAEPLHDEALSGGGAIFFVVTCLRNWPFCGADCAVALPLAAAISGSRADGCYAALSKFSPLSLRSFGEQNVTGTERNGNAFPFWFSFPQDGLRRHHGNGTGTGTSYRKTRGAAAYIRIGTHRVGQTPTRVAVP